LGTIHQRRPVERGGRGRPSTGRPEKTFLATKNFFFGLSVVRIGVQHPPPPVDRSIFWSGLQYILRFARFYAQYGPGSRDGGGVSASFWSDVFDG